MDKLSKYDEKWPGQESAEPIGAPPKGMWYDPAVKDSSEKEGATQGLSLNDALRYFLSNPTIIGRPAHINLQERTVQFDNGKSVSFDDLMTLFSQHSIEKKESDFGFFDGPKDIGKKPDGDFPSVQWMPRGTEDEDVDGNTTTASKKVAEEKALSNKIVTDLIPMFVDAIKPDDHKCGTCKFRIESENGATCSIVEGKIDLAKGSCAYWAEGEASKDANPTQMKQDTAGYVEVDGKINCSTCRHYSDQSCSLWAAKVKPEQCCMAWEAGKLSEASLALSKMEKKALEHPLTPDQMNEVAAEYGPEYNTALNNFYVALKNGHPKDKALAYAVAEMEKLGIDISSTALLEVVNNYLPA